ncbi:hypothetical protein LEMLEM_LOCUS4833, partial [Lemmus lemmus]
MHSWYVSVCVDVASVEWVNHSELSAGYAQRPTTEKESSGFGSPCRLLFYYQKWQTNWKR